MRTLLNQLRLALATLLTTCLSPLYAQVIVPPQAGNALTVTANPAVSSLNGLYTYSYSFTNSTSSAQNAWFIVVELSGDAATTITNKRAPKGWQALPGGPTPGVAWAATQIDAIPSNFVDDGRVLPSPYQIKPGQTLSGFSFQSRSPPTAVRFFAQGFTPIPEAVDAGDLTDAGYTVPDYTNASIIGVTQGPAPTTPSIQPSAEGLFSFVGLGNNAVAKGTPVLVGIQFNTTTASVDRTTFHASLNGRDITSAFNANPQGGLTASLGTLPVTLKTGSNVLQATVSGTVAGSTVPIYDSGRVKFYINTARYGDLNGDGVINCTDMAIIKAAFGKKLGEPGFDPRADVNGDGVVNILDLSAEAKLMPAGTTCN